MHNFIGLDFVINFKGEEVSGGSKLELGNTILLVLLDGDLLSAGQTLLFSPDDLDELLQILNFLWLKCKLDVRNFCVNILATV